jgi:Regulator of cell morphogenesis and NO signaling
MPDIALNSALSVNDTIREFPAALATLNEFGIDSCCGGAASLAEAARSSGVELGS